MLPILFSTCLSDVRSGQLVHGFLFTPREADFSELVNDSLYFELMPLPLVEVDFVFDYNFDTVYAPFGAIEIETPDTSANMDSLIENGGVVQIGSGYATTLPIAGASFVGKSFKIITAEGDTAYLFFRYNYIGGIDRFIYNWAYQFDPAVHVTGRPPDNWKLLPVGQYSLGRSESILYSIDGKVKSAFGQSAEEARNNSKVMILFKEN